MKFSKKIEKLIKKYSSLPPKIRVTPLIRTKEEEEKAKLLEKLIEYNWGTIQDRIIREVLRPMVKCFLFGNHYWIGCGKKGRHICRTCGWETSVMIDPKYTGEITWRAIK